MGTISTTGRSVFRDYVVEGAPGSGRNRPIKADIRALFDLIDALTVVPGPSGESAYQLAVDNGFVGTVGAWLTSLHGANGEDGAPGESAYQLAVDNGFVGTAGQWLASLVGKSAYQFAVDNGFVGTVGQWLDFLAGQINISSVDIAVLIRTAAGQAIVKALASGVVSIHDLRLLARPNRYDALAFMDDLGGLLAAFNKRGQLSHQIALGDNRDAVLAGSRAGNPYSLIEEPRSNRYMASLHGFPAPYAYRRDIEKPAHVYTGSRVVTTFIDYGQSWRGSWGVVPANYQFLGLQELALVLRSDQGSLPAVYFPNYYDSVADVWGITPENDGGFTNIFAPNNTNTGGGAEIGMFAALAFQKFCLAENKLLQAVLTFGTPIAASSWSQTYEYGDGQFLAPGSSAWAAQLKVIDKVPYSLSHYGLEAEYAAVGFTHGAYGEVAGGAPYMVGTYYAELKDMVLSYHLLGLPTGGRGLQFFIDQSSADATRNINPPSILEQVQFAAEHNNVHLIGPRYPYAIGANPHHTAEATCDIGVLEGYVKYLVLRRGGTWDCLRIFDWHVVGNTIVCDITNPFGTGDIVIDTATIADAGQNGFRLYVNAAERVISAVVISAGHITLTYSGAVAAGFVELMYAWKRADGVVDNLARAGVWGNIKARGPVNPLWNGGVGKTIDTWLCSFDQIKDIPA